MFKQFDFDKAAVKTLLSAGLWLGLLLWFLSHWLALTAAELWVLICWAVTLWVNGSVWMLLIDTRTVKIRRYLLVSMVIISFAVTGWVWFVE